MVYKSGFVTIVGKPNVGKSTLLNKILGQKIAIMSDKPQTTRNRIQGFYTTDDAQIIFIDTPGIHKPKHKLGNYMQDVAKRSLGGVDLVLYLLDAATPKISAESFIIEMLKEASTPVIVAINKIDTVEKDKILPMINSLRDKMNFVEIIPISASEGDNIDLLLEQLKKHLPEGPQYYPEDMITDQPEKQIIAELIREKILKLTRDEIPHSVAVETEAVKEGDNGIVNVQAVIYVERDSQKGIVIGKSGKMLKDIGSEARLEIEDLLGSKIFLELWVKVKKDWRNKDMALRNFGFDKRNI